MTVIMFIETLRVQLAPYVISVGHEVVYTAPACEVHFSRCYEKSV